MEKFNEDLFCARFVEVLDNPPKKVPYSSLAESLDVQRQTIYNWKSNPSRISFANVLKICAVLEANPLWLYFGAVQKRITERCSRARRNT